MASSFTPACIACSLGCAMTPPPPLPPTPHSPAPTHPRTHTHTTRPLPRTYTLPATHLHGLRLEVRDDAAEDLHPPTLPALQTPTPILYPAHPPRPITFIACGLRCAMTLPKICCRRSDPRCAYTDTPLSTLLLLMTLSRSKLQQCGGVGRGEGGACVRAAGAHHAQAVQAANRVAVGGGVTDMCCEYACVLQKEGGGTGVRFAGPFCVQYAILGLERGKRASSNVRHWMGASECNGVLCSRIPPPSTSHPHRPPSPAHTHVGCSKLLRQEPGTPGMPGMPARPCQSALGRPRAR